MPGIDGRSIVARRYRDIASAICADQGGLDRMTEARVQLVRRFAACAVLCEEQEARLVRREPLDLQEYSTLTSTLVRVASRLGINRVPKDVTPDLKTYIDAKATGVEATP